MNLIIDLSIPAPQKLIKYGDRIFLIGSCFTEHIGGRLERAKFSILQNPNGILFDPISVCSALDSYIGKKSIREDDLIYLNELWQSWDHHSIFSGLNATAVVNKINETTLVAHEFLRKADHLIVTLGSAFAYQLANNDRSVANCHRAPAKTFNKTLVETEVIIRSFEALLEKLKLFNPALQLIFTISPVRHIRDGVIENNRSKARLIEAVHSLVTRYENAIYFPAYELVIDVLRDYRFYDIDMAHPNYQATGYVFDRFAEKYIGETDRNVMEEINKIVSAYNHKVMHPGTDAHAKFLFTHLWKVQELQDRFTSLDFTEEENYFRTGLKHR